MKRERVWTRVDLTWESDELSFDLVAAWLLLLGIESTEDIPRGCRFYVTPGESHKMLTTAICSLIRRQTGIAESLLKVETEPVPERDWMEEWKKGFDVLKLSDQLWICPSWKSFSPPKGSFSIVMDPGMAFGTGHHASTSLIAEAMDDQMASFIAKRQPPEVIDVGTGTGVLAMGAALLGAKRVMALDTDPVAREIALENIQLNHLEHLIEITDLPISKIRRKFDLLLANILAEIHEQLFHIYEKRLEEGGVMVLSGIIKDRLHAVQNKIRSAGWVILNNREKGEWVCLTVIRERRRRNR